MTRILLAVTISVLIAFVAADWPIDVDVLKVDFGRDDDDVSYRLPGNIQAVHYDVEMTPYFEATATREAYTFDGVITLELYATAENVTEIVLQDNVKSVDSITVTDQNGMILDVDPFDPFIRDTERQFLIIRLRSGLTLVNGATFFVRIVYQGRMNVTPISRGVFRGYYRDSNNNIRPHWALDTRYATNTKRKEAKLLDFYSRKFRWYLASHLQPYHGRQAFPCLDEPGYKSTIDLVVNRPANFGQTFANMPIAYTETVGDRVREVFHRTPRMSAYLFTVHISEEFAVIADNNSADRSFRIIARPNAAGQGAWAQTVGVGVTQWLEQYLNLSYYDVADNMKNDQIAVPDWASGATENWGLVSYREMRLLADESETSLADHMSVAAIVAHELGHKWFGNLITAKWWDNVWVNEGFASYFEHMAVEPIVPEYQYEDMFIIYYLQSSLASDAAISTPPLNDARVNGRDSVTGHFSGISYSKGASLINMVKYMVTEDTFKKALNYFLRDRSFEEAEPDHIYEAFFRAVTEDGTMSGYTGVGIREFWQTWVNEAGYPILNVNVDRNTGFMTLTQERFFISASAAQTEQLWPIPITFTTASESDWDATRPVQVMTTKTLTIDKGAGDEWVIVNIKGTGIYRVNYDEHTWDMIIAALRNDVNSIHYLNRAMIVDDVFALMRSERLTYAKGFEILQFLKYDTSYFSWYPALTGFNWLLTRLSHLPDYHQALQALVQEYMAALIDELGWDYQAGESTTRTLSRFYILNFACNIGHEECILQARNRFLAMKNNGVSVNPNLRRQVFCSGVRNGDITDYNWLYQRMVDSNVANDEYVMLRTLPCTSDPTLINRYLDTVFTDTRAQDRLNAVSFALVGHKDNARTALDYFKQNHPFIRESMEGATRMMTVLSTIASYLDEEGLTDMEQWLNTNTATFPEYATGLNLITSYRANLAWGTQRADEIVSAVRGGATQLAVSVAFMVFSMMAIVFIA